MDKQDEVFLIEKIALVINRLTNLENREFGSDVDPWKGFGGRDFGIATWDWPQGVGLYGMEMFQNILGDTRYDEFFRKWVENNLEQGLPSANINTTAPYMMLLSLAGRTKEPVYTDLCIRRACWLLEGLPRTEEGGFQHVTTDLYDKNGVILNENQLWVDTLFMSVLFLAQAGVHYEKDAWIQEAIYQILIHIKYLYDPQTSLFYHGWSFERMDHFGGVFWSRGNSWFSYGILSLLEILQPYLGQGAEKYIRYTFQAQLCALKELQAESGLWHTILTDSESYEEVSGTAAFAAAMFKGMRLGILDKSFLACAEKALAAVVGHVAADGTVTQVSGGTAMGMDKEHYKEIIIAAMPYGQAMAVLAMAEAVVFYNEAEN